MPVETATVISDLEPMYPTGSDSFSEGDDHLRLLKSAIKNTFPNITGALTGTHVDLNALTDEASDLLDRRVPSGVIVMWSGTKASVPNGWAICDGANGTPDLNDRFILGNSGDTRGAGGSSHTATTSSAGSHNHGGSTANHTLTVSQIPAHTHGLRLMTSDSDGGEHSTTGVQGDINNLSGSSMNGNNYATSTGGGGAHSHNLSSDGAHNHTVDTRGKYYKLAFIMKL